MKKKGVFITLEGNEASGKSTQQKLIEEYLNSKDIETLTTREPGGTKLGEQLRDILLNYEVEKIDAITETFLLFAARAHHTEQLIKPALNKGIWVICDRFIDSSFAYQGSGRGISTENLEFLQKITLKDLAPDISFYFASDWQNSQERQKNRGSKKDRFEKSDKIFFEAVEEGFKAQAEKYSRIKTLNSNQSIEKISKIIFSHLDVFLKTD